MILGENVTSIDDYRKFVMWRILVADRSPDGATTRSKIR